MGHQEIKEIRVEDLDIIPCRMKTIRVTGSSTVRPYPYELSSIMEHFIQWKNMMLKDKMYHPVIASALIHSNILHIHPFSDGNGRTARLLLLLSLQSLGYYGIEIHKEERNEYMVFLEELQNGNPIPYFDFVTKKNLDFMKDILKNVIKFC